MESSRIGEVYITGAGPGDELLITLKAVECLKKADVVVYDNLVNASLLGYCGHHCVMIYAGKKAGHHIMEQDAINETLIRYALEGKTVVRLKGGDPFVFGRGGEEALALAEKNIPFEIVPGVTSGIAALAYAGIPVTHRTCGSTMTFVTGHESPGKSESDIDWEALSRLRGTIVFYMGVKRLPNIVMRLIANGKAADTPAALVRWGTTSKQEIITGTLTDIAQKAVEANFQPPALIVVGEVVELRTQLQWFEKRPLFKKRILVTRSRKQASGLAQILSDLGAEVTELPTIDIQPMEDYEELGKAIQRLESYKWIIFTSVNALDIFMDRLHQAHYDSRALHANKIAVIGEETAIALGRYGLSPDLKPERFTSEGVVDAFKQCVPVKDCNILIPTSDIARDVISSTLRELGAVVDFVPVYRNVIPAYEQEYITDLFSRPYDFVTFTSSSTVNNLVGLLNQYGLQKEIEQIRGASIGPVTSATARKHRIEIVTEANPHTIKGLVEAMKGAI